ncbi:MAG: hypothetical protein ACE5FS_06695 [Paracoccaceae bacterium]
MAGVVRTRRLFYVPGFDPMPPRRYRELYRGEGRRQAEICGYTLELGAGSGTPYNWRVTARIDGQETATRFEFLAWDDIVRASMDVSIPRTFALLLRTVWLYLRSGALTALFSLRAGPIIAALYPVLMLLAQLAFGLAAGYLAYRSLEVVSAPLAAAAALGVLWVCLAAFRRIDGRLYAYYLMQDYAFAARHAGRTPPELRPRLSEFVERIAAARRGGADEVMIVGHSSGAWLAVVLAAEVLRRGPGQPQQIALLTLGQAIPMVSFLPEARELRRDLRYLSGHPRVVWADVSAPGDGASFALCDPVQVTGVAPQGRPARWPVTISAAYSQTLSPQTLKKTRWRFFRRHIQYLCAFERPRDYDYFRITAGPHRLGDLLARRGNSRSRITRPCSPYRDTGQ